MSDITDQVDETQIDSAVVEQPKPDPKPEAPTNDQTGLRDAITKAVREQAAKEAEKPKPQVEVKDPKQPTGERERGPDGKFIPKDAAPAKVEQPKETTPKPSEGAQPGADQPKKADAAPGTWKAEAKAEWDKLPPSVKAETLRRESDFSREVGKYQQQIKQINDAYGPIEQLIGSRRALWRAQHGSEGEALKKLLNLSDLASQDPNAFLVHFLSSPDVAQRVDLQKVFGQQAPGDDIMRHPVVAKLQETVSGLSQQVSGFLNQQQTAATQTIEQQITSFIEAKDASGNPMRPHFETVREDVFKLVPALQAQFPGEGVEKVLQRAYDVAIHTNGNVAAEVARQNEERIRAEVEAKERAKKAQLANKSIQPTGPAPGNRAASASDPKDLRAELLRNYRQYMNGENARV